MAKGVSKATMSRDLDALLGHTSDAEDSDDGEDPSPKKSPQVRDKWDYLIFHAARNLKKPARRPAK